ncbi:glycosyltransferase family 2 protein, partial [Neobacillus niacini]
LYLIKGKENLGFAKGNNLVLNKIKNLYSYSLLLNNDTVITKNSISNMIDYLDNNPKSGVISCDIRYYSEPSKLWNAGGYFTWYGDRKYFKQSKIDTYKKNGVQAINTPFITGCALMARKEILLKYGILTEDFFFGEEDFNYCKRLVENNVKVESILSSTIYHKVGTSIKKSQKNINSFVLHFSNRIIDLKKFYKPIYWKVWRLLYLSAIFIKVFTITKNLNDTVKVCQYIFEYSTKYNEISYETFLEINNLV